MTKELNKIYDKIYSIADDFKNHKSAVNGFEGAPKGYKYIYALDYVDADIKNGGISQLHRNSTWHLILDAIEGCNVLGFTDLSFTLKEILFYYAKENRSKMKKRLPPDFFKDYPQNWDKSLDDLEDNYYDCFDKLKVEETQDLWEIAIVKHIREFV